MANINILSWNICFGCMYSDPRSAHDRTARSIAGYCEQLNAKYKTNVCLNNVAKLLMLKDYDFIGLQEATNWKNIYDILNPAKLHMSYVHHRAEVGRSGAYSEIVTFYNSARFQIKYAKVGNLDLRDGRPYQILFFLDKATSNNIIVINLHAPHMLTKVRLATELSRELNMCANLLGSTNVENCELNPTIDIASYINNNDFYIIAMGDFNDHGYGNFWEGMQLFENIVWLSPHIKNTYISSPLPPRTCCVGSRSLRSRSTDDTKYGDYILIDNTKLSYIASNRIPAEFIADASTYPTSDHMPVEAIIDYLPGTIPPVVPSAAPSVAVMTPSHRPPVVAPSRRPPAAAPSVAVAAPYHRPPVAAPSVAVAAPYHRPSAAAPSVAAVAPSHRPPVVAPPTVPSPHRFAIAKFRLDSRFSSRTLRLQDRTDDPNAIGNNMINGIPFKGSTISNIDVLMYPNGNIGINGLVLVADQYDPNIIGYVRHIYLSNIDTMTGSMLPYYFINRSSVSLRLQDDIADPNKYPMLNGNFHKGTTITNKNRLFFPNGQKTINNYVLIQKCDNRNVFGYINESYLTQIKYGSGQMKLSKIGYLKYLNKAKSAIFELCNTNHTL